MPNGSCSNGLAKAYAPAAKLDRSLSRHAFIPYHTNRRIAIAEDRHLAEERKALKRQRGAERQAAKMRTDKEHSAALKQAKAEETEAKAAEAKVAEEKAAKGKAAEGKAAGEKAHEKGKAAGEKAPEKKAAEEKKLVEETSETKAPELMAADANSADNLEERGRLIKDKVVALDAAAAERRAARQEREAPIRHASILWQARRQEKEAAQPRSVTNHLGVDGVLGEGKVRHSRAKDQPLLR